MYSVTSNGEVYEDALLGGLPGWRYATILYQARTKKRAGFFDQIRITDKAAYDKLTATTVATLDDIDAAVRKADEVYARSGGMTTETLAKKGEEYTKAQFVPSTPTTGTTPTLTPEVLSAKDGKGRKRKGKGQRGLQHQMAPWVLPAAVAGGAAFLLVVLLLARKKRKGAE